MLLKFSFATFLTLTSLAGTDAFLSHSVRTTSQSALNVGSYDNDGFLEALSNGGSKGDGEEEEVSSGSSRFKAMLDAAKANQAEKADTPSGVAIDNPFLNPAPASQPTNPEELSVEEQARLFREMMQKQQAPAPTPPAPQRVSKTDRAGRPVGRNRDADQIANTADVYFAQLKRDSTVRTMHRLRGDEDEADQVFVDEGIKELDSLLKKNPHLAGQREKEMALLDAVPEEMVAPYFNSANDNVDVTSAGISYKEKLQAMRSKRSGGGSAASAPEPAAEAPAAPAAQASVEVVPEPAVQAERPAPATPQAAAEPVTATPEEIKTKIRTLMGLILKHRGGPGFGSGLLKGPEIDRFENLYGELEAVLRSEAAQAAPQEVPMMTAPPAAPAVQTPAPAAVAPPAVPATPVAAAAPAAPAADMVQIDSTIACIEGAVTMYKNSPAELKQSILVPLRAALASAVETCNSIIGDNAAIQPPASSQPADLAQIDGTVACIEGAITMYKNSPPAIRESVLVTMRAALISAISSCDQVLGSPQVGTAAPVQQAAVSQAPAVPEPLPTPTSVPEPTPVAPIPGLDANSKTLEQIYENIKAASGEGTLGLRSDLSPDDATALSENLSDMREILMQELDAGIPDPGDEPVLRRKQKKEEPAEDSSAGGSTTSKYQAMLAKARAKKAA